MLDVANPVSAGDIELRDQVLAPGYGRLNAQVREAVRLAATLEGLLVEPVYTGRALAGLIEARAADAIARRSRVVFLHCGGLPALFGYETELRQPAQLLAAARTSGASAQAKDAAHKDLADDVGAGQRDEPARHIGPVEGHAQIVAGTELGHERTQLFGRHRQLQPGLAGREVDTGGGRAHGALASKRIVTFWRAPFAMVQPELPS
jgi:hypothetical protein